MKKTSPNSSNTDRIRSWAHTKAHGNSSLSRDPSQTQTLPLSNQDISPTTAALAKTASHHDIPPFPSTDASGLARQSSKPTANNVSDNTSTDAPPPAPPPQVNGEGAVIEQDAPKKKNVLVRFYLTGKHIIFSSYVNILLVFVPVGIAAKAAHLSPGLVFGMNAIAIVPLAGLLSHATESVAKRMGDTIGALMNVTFGNAVELIILYVLSPRNIRNGAISPANVAQHVCLPRKRSRQERARSPLKGIIISIASHIIPTFSLSPSLFRNDPYSVRAHVPLTKTYAHISISSNQTALPSKRCAASHYSCYVSLETDN
jgi:Ca2+:H+ antiporter